MQKVWVLLILLIIPIHVSAATLKSGRYSISVTYQLREGAQELKQKQRSLDFIVYANAVCGIRLYYRRAKDHYIDVSINDLHTLHIVDTKLYQPFIAAVVRTDGGALLLGYIEGESSLLTDVLSEMSQYKKIEHLKFYTDRWNDKKDSKNYHEAYARKYLWRGAKVGDEITYVITERDQEKTTEYEYVQRISRLRGDGIELELFRSDSNQSEDIIVKYADYPTLKIKKILPFREIKLNIENKDITTGAFEFEISGNDDKPTHTLSFMPGLFALGYMKGLNGLIAGRVADYDTIRVMVSYH